MAMNSGVNPAQSDIAELYIQTETVTFQREPPPPYQATSPVTGQPTVQTVIIQAPLKGASTSYTCHICGQRIITKVTYTNTKRTHMLAGFICGFTCWCSLCCLAVVPYITNTFKKAEHHCPNCNTYLGAYSKI